MRRTSLWIGVLGGAVGLLLSLRLFLFGLRSLIGGFDFGPTTMFWTALQAILYLCALSVCALLLASMRFRRASLVRQTGLLGVFFLTTAVMTAALCLPLVLPLVLNGAEVVLRFASPMAGVSVLLVAAVVELLVGTNAVEEETEVQN